MPRYSVAFFGILAGADMEESQTAVLRYAATVSAASRDFTSKKLALFNIGIPVSRSIHCVTMSRLAKNGLALLYRILRAFQTGTTVESSAECGQEQSLS